MLQHASSSSFRWLGALLLALVSSLAVGCGGGSAGKLPVDSPLTAFQAPDEEDLVGDDDDDEDEAEAAPAAEGGE